MIFYSKIKVHFLLLTGKAVLMKFLEANNKSWGYTNSCVQRYLQKKLPKI